MNFKKTWWMNVVGAICWALMGVALFFNKLNEQSSGTLATIVGMYLTLIAVPAFTARALGDGRESLARGMRIANWALIGLWAFGVGVAVFLMPRALGQSLLGAIAFVVPQAINLRALNRKLALPGRSSKPTFQPIVDA